jgi:hypothetical protein
MPQTFVRSLLIGAVAVLLVASAAVAETVAVGTCMPHLKVYSTISQAVAAVSSGSTVFVCPGTYGEQVLITVPLNLEGVQAGNADNPTITVPHGGLKGSVVAPTNGVTMFYQVLVQGTESATVNIKNLAVDGTSSANSGLNGWIEGIYYQNSSGTLSNVATYGQKGNGYGFGIFLEGTTAQAKTVSVKNDTVHDFDSEGIRTNGTNSSLTVNIVSNSVISSSSFNGKPVYGGIDVQGAMGSITNNRVLTHPAPAGVSAGTGIAFSSNSTVSGNTVVSFSVGIWSLGNTNTINSNEISLASGAVVVSGSGNVVKNNFVFTTVNGGAGISFNCTGTNNVVTGNLINQSDWGIIDLHGTNTIVPNTFSNVTNMVSGTC